MDQYQVYSQKVYRLPKEYLEDLRLEVEFVFKSTHVKSLDQVTFQMTTITSVEVYDGCLEASRYSRAEQLACLGIICFFTYIPMTVYDLESSKDEFQLLPDIRVKETIVPKLVINDDDETEDLQNLLGNMEKDVDLTVTTLDRIRKGLFLEESSYDANLHHDEVYMIYLGIVELLSDQFANEMKTELEKSIAEKLKEFYIKSLFYEGNKLDEVVKRKSNLLNEVIVSDELGLKNKILFMCKKLDVNHLFLEDFVSNLIRIRNRVAHGRTIYTDKTIWPLPPFFYLIDDSSIKLDSVFNFMTCIVQRFFSLNRFDENFKEFKRSILPSKEYCKILLKNPDECIFTKDELENGNAFNFTFETVFTLVVHTFSGVNIDEFANCIGKQFCDLEITEYNGQIILNISVLFAESKKDEVRIRAKENVEIIVRNQWYYWSNIKDLLRYLNYYNFEALWFEEWIKEKKYLQIR
jgi:hypothetical protein